MPDVVLTGWVLDLAATREGIEVWFRTAAGETFTLVAPFRPAFALAGPRLREGSVRAAAARWGCAVAPGEGTLFLSGRRVPAWTVAVPAPPALGAAVRRAERAFGPEALFNADIPAEQQFAVATGLFPFARAEAACGGAGTLRSARILDSPWDPDAPRPSLSAAFLRAEGTGHPGQGRVRPLAFTAGGRTHVLEWADGAGLLREVGRLVADADPDALVTEYGDGYIFPRLFALAGRLRIPFALGRPRRLPGEAPPRARGGPGREAGGGAAAVRRAPERSYFSYGRIVFRAAAHTLSGRWHVDARNSFLFGETGLTGLVELARLCGIPLQRLARSSPGTAISAMEVAAALRRGILVPFRKRVPEGFKTGEELVAADKGGLTYLPRPGLHGNVGELDFASMYPSLMARYNISPETIGCPCCRPGIPVPGTGTHTCARRLGLVPEVLAPVLAKRRLLKERQKGAATAEERETFRRRQTALKWILVVSFGFLGYRNARFGRIEAHEAVTAWGREKLLAAKETAEREGFAFLHGLTDALWVRKEGAVEADYRDLAERITAETGMPIALEGVYRWIAFLPSKRNPAVAVPNRFVGAFTDGEVKARGIALRRADTPPFVADLQRRLLAAMARAEDPSALRALLPALRETAEAAAAALREGRLPPEALAVARRLSKAPELYAARSAAALVARELCGRGVALRPGATIRYLLVGGGPGAARGAMEGRAMGFLDGSEAPDLARYEAMLREAAEELLRPLTSSGRS